MLTPEIAQAEKKLFIERYPQHSDIDDEKFTRDYNAAFDGAAAVGKTALPGIFMKEASIGIVAAALSLGLFYSGWLIFGLIALLAAIAVFVRAYRTSTTFSDKKNTSMLCETWRDKIFDSIDLKNK